MNTDPYKALVFLLAASTAVGVQLGTVSLEAPDDEAENVPVQPVFSWSPVDGAQSYQLQVSERRGFLFLDINESGITETSFKPSFQLDENERYYWRVRAIGSSGDDEELGPWSERWDFETGRLPGDPNLEAPSHGEDDVALQPFLDWDSASRADTYEVQLSLTSDFEVLSYVESGITETSLTVPVALDPETRYYWRVRASNEIGDGDYSNWRWFTTVEAAPDQVSLASPDDGAINVATKPAFSWDATPGADSYTLEVATTADFSSIVVQQSGIGGTNFTPSTALQNGAEFHWRVRGSNGAGDGPNSSSRGFVTVAGGPQQVVLVSPVDDVSDVEESPDLTWNAVNGASNYRVQVSTLSDFSGNLLHDTVVSGTQFKAGPLDFQTEHFWRVRASNAAAENWSSTRSFTTASGAPAQVALTFPEDGAIEQPLSVDLAWSSSSLAETYNVQVALDADFSVVATEETGLTETGHTVESLSHSTEYHWRVQGVNGAGPGPWSEGRKFTTVVLQSPAAPALTYPPDGSGGISGSPVFSWSQAEGADSYKLELSTSPPDEMENFVTVVTAVVVTQPFFQSPQLSSGQTHYWRVESRNDAGSTRSPVWSFTTATTTATGSDEVPADFHLEQNYPNPFNPSTRIQYGLPQAERVELTVTDVNGRLVATLISAEQPAGTHETTWNGRADDGSAVASGIYLYRLTAGTFTEVRRLVLVK